jgi:Histidine kinase-, DNA gyrase B-, and HSP90-like ATPase
MMGEICRAVLAEFAPRTVDGPELELDAPVPRWAVADSGGVAQILRILLDNAVRFSPRDKTVEVHLGVEHAARALSVRDDGTGVPEEDAEVIFERFQRGRDAGGEPASGLGWRAPASWPVAWARPWSSCTRTRARASWSPSSRRRPRRSRTRDTVAACDSDTRR